MINANSCNNLAINPKLVDLCLRMRYFNIEEADSSNGTDGQGLVLTLIWYYCYNQLQLTAGFEVNCFSHY